MTDCEESILSAQGTPPQHVVTASKVATILGRNPYRSRLEQWLIDTGQVEPDEAGEAAEWGLRLEPVILDAYRERTGRDAQSDQQTRHSSSFPWLGATLDAWSEGVPLELKTAGAMRASDWDDGVPEYYRPQVQTQMIVAGTSMAFVAALLGGQRLVIHDMEWDDELAAEILRETREYARQVDEWEPPAPDGSESAQRALLRLYPEESEGKMVTLSSSALEAHETLQDVERDIKRLESQKKSLRQQIEAELGDAERGVLPGGQYAWAWTTVHRKGYEVQPTSYRQLKKVKL